MLERGVSVSTHNENNRKLENEFNTFTPLEKIYRDYYRKNGELYPLGAFLDMVGDLNKQGNVLFSHGLTGMENIDGELQLSEMLFRDGEDVSIDKHPRYNPEFVHQHQFFEIVYVLNGHCRHTIYSPAGSEKLTCVNGDTLILPPGILHSIMVDDDNSIILDILVRKSSFDKAFLHNIPDTTVLADFFTSILYSPNHANYILFHTDNDQRIRDLVFEIYREYTEAQIYFPVLMNLLLAQLFMHILRGHSDSVTFSRDYPRDVDYIPMVIQYMENNYTWLTVQDIATHFSFSPSHLGRIYKAFTSSTISESLRTIRMKKAADFLLGSPKSVEEIAGMVGYLDTTNFIRRFKQHYGQTPKQYRISKQTM